MDARQLDQIQTAAGESVHGLAVSLAGVSSTYRTTEEDVQPDGSFEFGEVPVGVYTLRVTDGRRSTAFEESVTVRIPMPGYEGAAAELEKALSISPEFRTAHTNLGVQYFRLGRFADSAAEWTRAIQIGGPDPVNLCNRATA